MLDGPGGGYKVRHRDSVFPGGKRGLLGSRFKTLSPPRWTRSLWQSSQLLSEPYGADVCVTMSKLDPRGQSGGVGKMVSTRATVGQ